MQLGFSLEKKDIELAKALPVGAFYCPDFLALARARDLLNWIDHQDWDGRLSRRTQHYGAVYDYTRRKTTSAKAIASLPPILAQTARAVQAKTAQYGTPLTATMVLVNDYQPGQGIAPHIDATPNFGPVLATLSLGAPVLMDFQPSAQGGAKGQKPTTLWLMPGSLLVLSGAARYDWLHGIAKRKNDRVEGRRLARGRRVSVTFRTLG